MFTTRKAMDLRKPIVLLVFVFFMGATSVSARSPENSNSESYALALKNTLDRDAKGSSSPDKDKKRTPFAVVLPWALLLGVFFVIKERNSGSRNANL